MWTIVRQGRRRRMYKDEDKHMKKDRDKKKIRNLAGEGIALTLLLLYPLRHINWGLDLWDTGYNYANFQYFGMDHMDPMWFFSTYLANGAGSLLMKLPGAGGLIGMNLYTGLSVSLLALTGYFFCTRRLGMSKAIVFLGEMTAVSLCWCPTALLYNYLTYLLFLAASVLLYRGLVEEKRACLAGAGLLLGTNVLVRFSNLPEAGMILAVWVYDFLLWRQEKKTAQADRRAQADRTVQAGLLPRPVRHTLWCLAGYLGALALLLGFIHIRYGLGEYVGGIQRLFAMTERATDYKPAAMIMGILGAYVENLYWFVRIMVILLGGALLCAAAGWLERLCRQGGKKALEKKAGKGGQALRLAAEMFRLAPYVLCALLGGGMLWWLYSREFCSLLFTSYDSMLRPGVLFLTLTLLMAAVRIFSRGAKLEEKLISGMLILIILLTSIGSNNGIYPSLNNLFLAAPYVFWQSWRFLKYKGERMAFAVFPAKALLLSFLALCLFQFAGFGAGFVFAEATGVQDPDAYVENNAILKNVRMSPQKARWMEELSAFADENGLKGREVILYGSVPALSYYLQMPSAFNPWSDLDSYGYEVMVEDIEELGEAVRTDVKESPIVIVENRYILYKEGGTAALEKAGVPKETREKMAGDQKWRLLLGFMEDFGYKEVFRNEKFTVYQ